MLRCDTVWKTLGGARRRNRATKREIPLDFVIHREVKDIIIFDFHFLGLERSSGGVCGGRVGGDGEVRMEENGGLRGG